VPTNLSTVRWIHGAPEGVEPVDTPIQVVAYDDDTYVMRQSMSVDFEAPFMYLLFGSNAVLLHDTGATESPNDFPLRRTVDELIASRLARRGGTRPRLIVSHSHRHGDHHAGDGQFADLPAGSVAGLGTAAVAQFFGIAHWPAGRATLDLGGRVLDVLPTPGHEDDHICLFDRRRGLLLTGDTLYPGLITVRDWGAYRRSTARLAEFVRGASATTPVRAILGAHIEMSTSPGTLYEIGSTHQPDEAPLPLPVDDLFRLNDALAAVGEEPREIPGARVIVRPVPGE
jgi:hydroxyacylglutathione hydrolase